MKAALVAILLATSAFAQGQLPLAAAEAACGPHEVQFSTKAADNQPLSQPETGKSLVYVAEVFENLVNQITRPTLRVGLDGTWVGAVKGDTYISFSIDPGEHHLCTKWQPLLKQFSDKAAFTSFTADPGKVYYFRARIIAGGSSFALDLESVNEDEGKYLVASSAFIASQPKK